MRRRPALILAGISLGALVLMGGPSGRLAIQLHDLADPSPHRVEASLELGKAALSLLITWTTRR